MRWDIEREYHRIISHIGSFLQRLNIDKPTENIRETRKTFQQTHCAFGLSFRQTIYVLKHIYHWGAFTLLEMHHIYVFFFITFAKHFQENDIELKPERTGIYGRSHRPQNIVTELNWTSWQARKRILRRDIKPGNRLQTPLRGRYIKQLWAGQERGPGRCPTRRDPLCPATAKDDPAWCMGVAEPGIYNLSIWQYLTKYRSKYLMNSSLTVIMKGEMTATLTGRSLWQW